MRARVERIVAAGRSIVEQRADRKIGRLKLKCKAQPRFAMVLVDHNIITNAKAQP